MRQHNWWIVYQRSDGGWGALDRRDQSGFEYRRSEVDLQLAASALTTRPGIRSVFLTEATSRHRAITQCRHNLPLALAPGNPAGHHDPAN